MGPVRTNTLHHSDFLIRYHSRCISRKKASVWKSDFIYNSWLMSKSKAFLFQFFPLYTSVQIQKSQTILHKINHYKERQADRFSPPNIPIFSLSPTELWGMILQLLFSNTPSESNLMESHKCETELTQRSVSRTIGVLSASGNHVLEQVLT